MRNLAAVLLLFFTVPANAQRKLTGIVLDSLTRQPLPFATVQASGKHKAAIATIDGKFSMSATTEDRLLFSYSGYRSKTVAAATLRDGDTVLLAPATAALDEVVVRLPTDKIKRIVNTAIANKSLHNPDRYASYQCNVYYKMIVDIAPYGNYNRDSIRTAKTAFETSVPAGKSKETPRLPTRALPLLRPATFF